MISTIATIYLLGAVLAMLLTFLNEKLNSARKACAYVILWPLFFALDLIVGTTELLKRYL